MPNQPATPTMSLRVAEALKDHVKAKTAANGETITDLTNRFYRGYVAAATDGKEFVVIEVKPT